MKKSAAINLAIDALKRRMKDFAVDANLYERKMADYPHAKKAYEQRQKMRDALQVLEEMLEEEANKVAR